MLGAFVLSAVAIHAAVVTKIAAGQAHSMFVKSDGSLWVMGNNEYGMLGAGLPPSVIVTTNFPAQIVASGVADISAGDFHNLFIKSDGSLWAMGRNDFGELGDGTYLSTNVPKQVVASGVTNLAAGFFHSLFLKNDGSLWVMGSDSSGQLGDGTLNETTLRTNLPEMIVASDVTAIAGGDAHSLFLKSDGSLWAMGSSGHGQLGAGNFVSTNTPERIVASGVTAVAAGFGFSLFIKSDGSLWGMGYNANGRMGAGSTFQFNAPVQIVASNVTAIAAGWEHSLFLKSDGSLWAMGNESYGQLGNGVGIDGFPNVATNTPQLILSNSVTAISAGDYHSLFIKSDGSLWGMGLNSSGQLGVGSRYVLYSTNRPILIVGVPLPAMNIVATSLSGSNVVLNCVNGVLGSTNFVLASTNVELPRSQWALIQTNKLLSGGDFTVTVTNAFKTNFPKRFFLLNSQ